MVAAYISEVDFPPANGKKKKDAKKDAAILALKEIAKNPEIVPDISVSCPMPMLI